jgi:signal transduction histidine kinase
VKRRLLVSYLVLTLVILAAVMVPLAVTYERRARENLEADLTRDAFVVAAYVEDILEHSTPGDLGAVARNYQDRSGARVVIVARDGNVLADSSPPVEGPRNFGDRPEFAEALDGGVATGSRPSDTLGTSLFYVAVPVTSGGEVHGAVRLTYSTAQVDERVHRYWLMLGGVAAVSLGAAAGVGLLLARWVTRPIRRLQAAATALGDGALDSRAPTESGPPELRRLAMAFNGMAVRLEQLLHAQEQFVADASHQLRTPLTAIRLRLEMLEGDVTDVDADPARISEDIAAAQKEAARLGRLVDGLLALATAERAGGAGPVTPVRLAPLIEDRVDAWTPIAAERGVRLQAVPRQLVALATEDRLTQVLDNLLANAIDASPAGTAIRVEAVTPPTSGARHGTIELHVTDEGRGMSAEQRAHAFDRFWSAGSARTALGGSGLGLAIVEKLVHADGGSVTLLASPSGGLDVVVRLRAATNAVPLLAAPTS